MRPSLIQTSISLFVGVIWLGASWGILETMQNSLPLWQILVAEGGLGIFFVLVLNWINKVRK